MNATARSAHEAGFQVALIAPLVRGIDGTRSQEALGHLHELVSKQGGAVIGQGEQGDSWEKELRQWLS